MAAFVFFMNLLALAFALVFAAELSSLLIGCVIWLARWKRGRRS